MSDQPVLEAGLRGLKLRNRQVDAGKMTFVAAFLKGWSHKKALVSGTRMRRKNPCSKDCPLLLYSH